MIGLIDAGLIDAGLIYAIGICNVCTDEVSD
jgi:hypothetical protein